MKKELSIIKVMSITILGSFGKMIKALLKLLYLIEQTKNNLIAKLFMKLPRTAKVIMVYTLVILSGLQVMNFASPNKTTKQVVEDLVVEKVEAKTTTEEIIEEQATEQVVETEQVACNFSNQIACDIYNNAISKGATNEQAIIIIAISAHETGYWESNLFVNANNFGGHCNSKGFIIYDNYEEGLNAHVNLLLNGYFAKGLDTIEKIGAKYCPVGASNDKNNLNTNWVPSVTSIYNSYLAK